MGRGKGERGKGEQSEKVESAIGESAIVQRRTAAATVAASATDLLRLLIDLFADSRGATASRCRWS